MNLSYARAFVTGGSGFVGSALVHALCSAGVETHVLLLEKNIPSRLEHCGPLLFTHQGNLLDKESLHTLLLTIKPDVVFHLAAYGTFTQESNVARMVDVNVKGTVHVLHAAQVSGCKTVVCTGSAKEYATSRIPIPESATLHAWDAYAATKIAASGFARLAAERNRLPTTVLRLAPVYGPGDDPSRFFQVAVRSAITGEPMAISVGELVRNFVYIDDVVSAYMVAGTYIGDGSAINIGGAEVVSFNDVVCAIEDLVGKTITQTATPKVRRDDDSWTLDTQKAERVLHWKPSVSLREGLARIVETVRR